VASVAVFVIGALVSLSMSWVLVTRLERLAERAGLSEGLLGVIAALAADAPEVTAAITALAHHQQHVGAGVVIGSNVFNLAALLGLGAVVAGRIALHRKVVVLSGVVAAWIAVACVLVVLGLLTPVAGIVVVAIVFVPYLIILGLDGKPLPRLPGQLADWMAEAVIEEEIELAAAIRPRRGRPRDAAAAAGALVLVVTASVAMEVAASALGRHYAVPGIVTGGVVLAAVTSLPNAVAAVYLAAKGRGAAVLSIALNSNALNVIAGLMLPAAITGLGRPSGQTTLIATWYAGLTLFVLAVAYRDRGVRRGSGLIIIGAYLIFLGSLLATAYAVGPGAGVIIGPAAAVAAACLLWLAVPVLFHDHGN
jgi:cation:H+ antiporter